MNYFIIGDVHGCYFTSRKLIEKHWSPEEEKLVQVGDIVNKGKHTFAVLEYFFNLKNKYGDKVVLLKGNNEYLFQQYYSDSINISTKQKFENYNMDYLEVLDWMNKLPHFWQNGKVFMSHAGIDVDNKKEIPEDDLKVIFNRNPLKNIGKTQFVGHIVVDEAKYDKKANAWYLDTGAGYGKKLTGLKVNRKGKVLDIISYDVHPKDLAR